jgi:hypothetical protein
MCYVIVLSTTSAEDLARHNSDRLRFARELPDEATVEALNYPHRWYVGSKSGCSCTFRHLHSTELGFGSPVDWYPEEGDEITATLEFVAVVRALVEAGERVDCIDAWSGEAGTPEFAERLAVDLATLADSEFRFFEAHHFDFVISQVNAGLTS